MNDKEIIFTDEQKEYLQEIMNIAYGRGTAAIADIIESFAKMAIPQITILKATQLKEYLLTDEYKDQKCFLSTQVLNGDIFGENLFIMNEDSAKKLAHEFKIHTDITETILSSIVLEITNILSTTTIGKLAEELGTESYFEPPKIQTLENSTQLDETSFLDYKQVIAISTVLEFEQQKIYGKLMLLVTDDSILWIQEAIDKIIAEF